MFLFLELEKLLFYLENQCPYDLREAARFYCNASYLLIDVPLKTRNIFLLSIPAVFATVMGLGGGQRG